MKFVLILLLFIEFVHSNKLDELNELDFLTTTIAPKVHVKYDENIQYLLKYKFTESDFEFAHKGIPFIKATDFLISTAWEHTIGYIQLEELKKAAKRLYYIDGIERRVNDLANSMENNGLRSSLNIKHIFANATCKEIGQIVKFLDAQLPQVRECTHLKLDRIVEIVKSSEGVKDEASKDRLVEHFAKISAKVNKELTDILHNRLFNARYEFQNNSDYFRFCEKFD